MTRLLAIIHSHWFSILWLGVIFLVTLVPLEATGERPSILCVLCGDGAIADSVLNAALFLPLGAALSVARWRRLGALALGAILSFGVETAQFAILGRDPSLSDLLSNTLGTALGIALVSSASTWWRPGPRMAQVLSVSAAIGTASVLVLTGILLRPSFPDETYYGGWTPRFGHLEWYGGRLVAASLDGLEIPSGVVARSADVRRHLLSGATLHVRAHAGPPPPGLAPLLTIHDRHQREIILLGIDGDELVYRYRTRAIAWGLDGSEIRVGGALRGIAWPGPLSLVVRQTPSGHCVRVNATEHCGLGYTVGTAWTFLLGTQPVSPGLKSVFNVFWLAALLFPVGLWTRFGRLSVAIAAFSVGSLLILPPAVGLLPTPRVELLGAFGGFLAGWASRAASARLCPTWGDLTTRAARDLPGE